MRVSTGFLALLVIGALIAMPAILADQHLADRIVQTVLVDNNGRWLVGVRGGDGVYAHDGAGWLEYGAGLEPKDIMCILQLADGSYAAGTWGGGVYRRSTDANQWARLGQDIDSQYDYIRAMAQAPDQSALYAADPARYVYRLRAGEQSWERLRSDGLPDQHVLSLFDDGDGRLYAGMANAGVYEYDSVQQTWQAMGGPQEWTASGIDFGPDGRPWVAANNGVYRWSDQGWHVVAGTQGWNVFTLKRNPHVLDEVIVGTEDGRVYRITDARSEPEPLPVGIPEGTRVWSIAFGAGEPQPLLVGTGQGLYTTELTHPTPTPTPTATPTARPNEAMTIGMWHSLVPGTEELAYTISYGNCYPEVVDNVVITNMVPLTVTLVSDSYENGNCEDATPDVVDGRTKLTWVCREVAPGDGGSVGYRVQLPAGMLSQALDLAARRPPDPQETPTPPPAIVNDGAYIRWEIGKETYYQKTARDVFSPDPVLLPVVKVMH